LIRWNGGKLAQMKLKLTKEGTSGSMEIPVNLLSGNYYLRAYTKWMRNYSAQNYAYSLVKIVNPFRSETDEGPTEVSAINSTSVKNMKQQTQVRGVSCTMDKNEYRPEEKAEVDLYINDKKLSEIDRYCISVAKVGVIDTAIQNFETESPSTGRNVSYIEYIPEIRGITITGEVIDKSTQNSLKNILISLSETEHGEYFSVYQTDEKGRFVFLLPDLSGKHDFFIQTEAQSEILIDNGFCNQPVKLPYFAFNLKAGEVQLIKDMAINQQLSERFLSREDSVADSQTGKEVPIAFYGSKRTIYHTEKYIELPNIQEFISEIILEAEISNKKGKTSLISMRRTNLSNYPPLIFLDNIQVDNNDQLLRTPLNRIERVEVINMDYIVAGMRYSGIISIYSKNRDFAGSDLNKNSTFFTYELFSDIDTCYDFKGRSDNSRIPDRRNLLYWNPDIQLSADKKTTISFQTSDCKGEYVIYIRGKNSREGNEIYGKCFFSVK
jgi:hypothetical protein